MQAGFLQLDAVLQREELPAGRPRHAAEQGTARGNFALCLDRVAWSSFSLTAPEKRDFPHAERPGSPSSPGQAQKQLPCGIEDLLPPDSVAGHKEQCSSEEGSGLVPEGLEMEMEASFLQPVFSGEEAAVEGILSLEQGSENSGKGESVLAKGFLPGQENDGGHPWLSAVGVLEDTMPGREGPAGMLAGLPLTEEALTGSEPDFLQQLQHGKQFPAIMPGTPGGKQPADLPAEILLSGQETRCETEGEVEVEAFKPDGLAAEEAGSSGGSSFAGREEALGPRPEKSGLAEELFSQLVFSEEGVKEIEPPLSGQQEQNHEGPGGGSPVSSKELFVRTGSAGVQEVDNSPNAGDLSSGEADELAGAALQNLAGGAVESQYNQGDLRSPVEVPVLPDLPAKIIPQIVEQAGSLSISGAQEMRLRLQPEFLGEVLIRVRQLQEGVLTAEIITQHHAVKELLASQLDTLRQRFQEVNLPLEHLAVFVQAEGENSFAFAGDTGGRAFSDASDAPKAKGAGMGENAPGGENGDLLSGIWGTGRKVNYLA